MRVEDARVLGSEAEVDLLLHGQQLAARFRDGGLEAGKLVGNFLCWNGVVRDVIEAVVREDENFATTNARGHGDAVQNLLSLVSGVWHGLPVATSRGFGKPFRRAVSRDRTRP